MIEGSLTDVSLAGLLQFLATEVDKCFAVRISRGGQRGEINICNGDLMQANFGLLEGDDALCEYLSWKEGHFIIERLPTLAKNSVKRNLSVNLHPGNTFADHCLYLIESNVGLNTDLVASDTFGTQEWHQALRTQPLEKHDFAIIGWVSDGRTMRHAMREFSLNITEATASLYRLVFTKSVVAVRPTFTPPALVDVMESLASQLELEEAQAAMSSSGQDGSKPANVTTNNDSDSTRREVSARNVKPSEQDQISGTVTVSRAESAEPTKVTGEHDVLKSHLADSMEADGQKMETEATVSDAMATGPFNIRRTDPLPLVTIDIERLFQSTFSLTQFGDLALTNQSLDSFLRHVLSAVQSGKSFIVTVNESTRPHPSTLATFRYCFDRGYVDQPDPVLIVTCDLLLGRVELEQYLLQRRRITGDELQTLVRMSTSEGRALPDLLVAHGFLTEGDLERWMAEKSRFSSAR